MKIISGDNVRLTVISKATESQPPKSVITIKGINLKLTINGVNLESCIECNEHFLVFTTNDCPFEESLNIYLLSRKNEIVDSATMLWPYSTGSFELLRVIDPNLVQFRFFGDTDWQISIFKRKRLQIPYISECFGVWRKLKLWRFFGISEVHPKS